MESRERVEATLNGGGADRLPASYSAHAPVTGALMQRLGVSDQEGLYRALGVDMWRHRFAYLPEATGPDAEGYMRNGWGVRLPEGEGRLDLSTWVFPFDDSSTLDDIEKHSWPTADAFDYSGIGEELQAIRDKGFVSFGGPWCPFFHELGWIIGQENYFLWMATRPEELHALTEKVVGHELEVTRRYLEAADGRLDILYIGNDFGTQRGLFISPEQWREYIAPYLRRYYQLAHDFDVRVMQHSCGAIREIIPDLIALGVDILDPIQTACSDMTLESLYGDFSESLSFHGGVDTQHLLPVATPEQVRGQVRNYMALSGEGGHYFLSGSQEFMEDIPIDNILALYEENRKGF